LKSLFQGGKLSGKCTARRRDSGEFLVKENTKGEAGDSESLRLKDREGANTHLLCPFLLIFFGRISHGLHELLGGTININVYDIRLFLITFL